MALKFGHRFKKSTDATLISNKFCIQYSNSSQTSPNLSVAFFVAIWPYVAKK